MENEAKKLVEAALAVAKDIVQANIKVRPLSQECSHAWTCLLHAQGACCEGFPMLPACMPRNTAVAMQDYKYVPISICRARLYIPPSSGAFIHD